jgi:phosphoethanolamine N-methyltransferase
VAETDRYTRHAILRAEQMYGRGFQSPGQREAVDRAAALLDLQPGQRVLDVGSGLGGPAMHLATVYGVHVLGLDTAAAMVEMACERLGETDLRHVDFRHGDVRTLDLPADSFDPVWTRDTLLYVADKPSTWRALHRLLRRGGRLYVADFCLGPTPASTDFVAYLAHAGYHLRSIPDYAAALTTAGFADARGWDETDAFEQSLAAELTRLERVRDTFLGSFSADDYRYLTDRRAQKIAFCRRGELAWGWFLATKPVAGP